MREFVLRFFGHVAAACQVEGHSLNPATDTLLSLQADRAMKFTSWLGWRDSRTHRPHGEQRAATGNTGWQPANQSAVTHFELPPRPPAASSPAWPVMASPSSPSATRCRPSDESFDCPEHRTRRQTLRCSSSCAAPSGC
jgi:hypothetical protein